MNEIHDRVIQLCIEKKRANEPSFYKDICDVIFLEFGKMYTPEKIRAMARKYRFENHLDDYFYSNENPDSNKRVSVSYDSDGNSTSEKSFQLKKGEKLDAETLLLKHGFDKDEFSLVSAKNSIWPSRTKNNGTIEMCSSKITVKPTDSFVWSEKNVEKIFENIKIKSRPLVKQKHSEETGRFLVLPISDLHLGLLAEKNVTGNDYNLEIATDLFYYVINDVLLEIGNNHFDELYFVIGNDFLNCDNIMNTTTKGTPQECSNQWHTVVDRAVELCINGIETLISAQVANKINVVYAVSNHDYHTMYGIMNTIKAYYKNVSEVVVYGDPSERKYFKLGNTILGISHDLKVEKALEIMSVEAHDLWSESTSMIWMLGHLHTQMAYSKKGYVEVLRLPTVSGWSRWSNQQGFVQTERKNQAFIIDGDTGIKTTINTIIKL